MVYHVHINNLDGSLGDQVNINNFYYHYITKCKNYKNKVYTYLMRKYNVYNETIFDIEKME